MTILDAEITTSIKLSAQLGVYVALAENESELIHADEFFYLRISTFVAAAFVRYAPYVENAFGNHNLETLCVDARDFNCSYVVQPVILKFKGPSCSNPVTNAAPTEAHQLRLRLDIHDVESGKQLNSETFHIVGSFDRLGVQCPCDLLVEPLEQYTTKLYL